MGGLFGGGGGGDGGAAARARADEIARQGRVAEGTASINKAFEAFNPEYYAERGQAYSDFANPQLEDQHLKAQKALMYALSRTGNLSSSMAAEKRADVSKQYNEGQTSIVNRMLALENKTKAEVESNRGKLISELNMTSDPSAAALQANTRADLLANRPSFNPIGQMFQNITAGLADMASNSSNNYAGVRNLFFNDSSNKSNIVRN